MKYFLIFSTVALLCLTNSSFAQVRLNGDLRALGNSTVIIQYYEGNVSKSVTKQVTGGKFSWEAPVTEAQKITMIFPGRATWIFIEPGTMTVKGSRDSLEYLTVTGSKTNDEALAYAKLSSPLLAAEKSLFQVNPQLREDEEIVRKEKLLEIAAQKNAMASNYIAAHQESAFSLNLVTESCRLGTYEELLKLYNLLGKKMKSTSEGKRIAERLAVLKRSAIGEKMKDFTKPDDKGNAVNFSAYQGKYVLIDFWASWCVPCRKEIPNIIKNYHAYKDQNFTVISISLDDLSDKNRWLSAIASLKMPWVQLADLKGFDDELSIYYGIKAVPTLLLIDPKGNIIAKDLRGITLDHKLKALFKKS